MSMFQCNRCHNYIFRDTCSCERFEVIHEDYHTAEDPYVVWAIDEECAAEAYAKYFNEGSCDFTMMDSTSGSGEEITVWVNEKQFSIEAEPTITYNVTEI